jgi:lysozyme family protein
MNNDFDRAFEIIVGVEGGYVNDPSDPGGETKFGISARCLEPSSRVLTASLDWVPISEVSVGDKLLAFDELPERHGKLNLRRFKESDVLEIGRVRLMASQIITENRVIIASDDHQWLRRWGTHKRFDWCKTSDLLVPKGKWTNGVEVRIGTVFDPWAQEKSYEAGYLAGVLDGEGNLNSHSIGFSQKDNCCKAEAIRCAEHLGLEFKQDSNRRDVGYYRLVNNNHDPFQYASVLGRLGAKRLKSKLANKIIGRSIASINARHDLVKEVIPIGATDLIGISTSTKTLIVEGLMSHNSYPDEDIRGLTKQRAKEIYRRDYWDMVRANELEWPFNLVMFDSAVNQGVSTAIKIAQTEFGLQIDGVFGPKTLSALRGIKPIEAATQFLRARAEYYRKSKKYSTYGKGWENRLFRVALAA